MMFSDSRGPVKAAVLVPRAGNGRLARPTVAGGPLEHHPPVKRSVLAAAVALLALAACVGGGDPPPADAPDFPGYDPITQYAGNECHTVLLVGDSLITPTTAATAAALEGSGRCTDVVQGGVNGSAPGGDAQGVVWRDRLADLIDQEDPDVLVIEFIGNGFPSGDQSAYMAEMQDGLAELVGIGQGAGVSTYVAVPPDVLTYSDALAGAQDFIAWQRATDLGAPKIDIGAKLTPTGYTAWLRFPDGIKRVRQVDNVHLSDLGITISGATVAAGIQLEWSEVRTTGAPDSAPPSTSTPAPPSTTTTTPPPSSTEPE